MHREYRRNERKSRNECRTVRLRDRMRVKIEEKNDLL